MGFLEDLEIAKKRRASAMEDFAKNPFDFAPGKAKSAREWMGKNILGERSLDSSTGKPVDDSSRGSEVAPSLTSAYSLLNQQNSDATRANALRGNSDRILPGKTMEDALTYTPEEELERFAKVTGQLAPDVETEEARKKRERHEAIRLGWSGLIDGLNALSNLYYTTRWAPNMRVPDTLGHVRSEIEDEGKRRAATLAKQQEDLAKQKSAMDKAYMDWRMRMAQDKETANRNVELENVKQAGRMQLAEYNQNEAAKRTQMQIDATNKRAGARAKNSRTSLNQDSLTLIENGNPKVYMYDKSMNGSLLNVYNVLRDVTNDENGNSTIEDIKMQMGEGGDISSKTMTIIKRALKEHGGEKVTFVDNNNMPVSMTVNEYVKSILRQGARGQQGGNVSKWGEYADGDNEDYEQYAD